MGWLQLFEIVGEVEPKILFYFINLYEIESDGG